MAHNALYVDPDLTTRLRFKQVVQASTMFDGFVAINTLLEALERLDTGKAHRIIYLASKFTTDVLSSFITAARRTLQGGKAVFMIVIERHECDPTTLAGFALAGADGFLVSPFSTEGLFENVEICGKLLSIRNRRHQELSIELLVKAALGNFSNYARSTKERSFPIAAREELRRTYKLIAELPSDLLEKYQDLIVEKLTDAPASRGRRAPATTSGFMPTRRAGG
jgi:response regulator RpfG family c-di-GMP phosphodiesterase